MWKKLAAGSIACLTLSLTAFSATAAPLPRTGKLLKLVNGDLMCYIDLRDARGKIHTLGADFDICTKEKLINRKVQLTYKRMRVNDCESAEPCGKTRWQLLVSGIKPFRR
jgi:hypothetical protein